MTIDKCNLENDHREQGLAPAPVRAARPDERTAYWDSFLGEGPIDVSVCIANWNCRELLRVCLGSLLDCPQGVRLEVIVVDNASSDGAAEMVAREFPEVVLVRNPVNRGFARASNQAAERAAGRYLFFLNNDTQVPPETLGRLVAYAEAIRRWASWAGRARRGAASDLVAARPTPASFLPHLSAALDEPAEASLSPVSAARGGLEPAQFRRGPSWVRPCSCARRLPGSRPLGRDFFFGGEGSTSATASASATPSFTIRRRDFAPGPSQHASGNRAGHHADPHRLRALSAQSGLLTPRPLHLQARRHHRRPAAGPGEGVAGELASAKGRACPGRKKHALRSRPAALPLPRLDSLLEGVSHFGASVPKRRRRC